MAPGKFSYDRRPSNGAFQRLQDAWQRIKERPDQPGDGANAAEKEVVTGTAFVVSDDGYLLTNYHVIEGCKSITVLFQQTLLPDYLQSYLQSTNPGFATGFLMPPMPQVVRVVKTDQQNDLALLILESVEKSYGSSNVPTFRDDTRPIALGESVTVVGFPLRGLLTEINVTTGTVSSLAGIGGGKRFIQHTAPVQAGNSGGPLLDDQGNVIGVVVSKLDLIKTFELSGDFPQNVNFAIRGEVVREFLRSSISLSPFSPTEKKETYVFASSAQAFTFPVECQK